MDVGVVTKAYQVLKNGKIQPEYEECEELKEKKEKEKNEKEEKYEIEEEEGEGEGTEGDKGKTSEKEAKQAHAVSALPEVMVSSEERIIKMLSISDCSKMNVDELFDLFKYEKTNVTKEMQKNLENVSVAVAQKDLAAVRKFLSKVLKEVRPFDLQRMKYLLDQANKAVGQVKNQNIILLLGFTGAGKSTTIHFLAGSALKKVKLKDGLMNLSAVEVKNEHLHSVKISAYMVSETKFMTAVPIKYDGDAYVLCDSPGFLDTSGPEVDLANSIGLIRAIRDAKSVKPLVLISPGSVNEKRGGGIRDIARILVDMLTDLKGVIKNFEFGFTKYTSKDEKEELHAKLKDLQDKLDDSEKGTPFACVLKQLVKKTKRGKALFIEPISGDPDDVLDRLVDGGKISNPNGIFQPFMTPETKNSLQVQVGYHRKAITLGCDRHDYELVNNKLDELKMLADELESDDHKQTYDALCGYIGKRVHRFYVSEIDNLNRLLSEGKVKLAESDVTRYGSAIDSISSAECLHKHSLGVAFNAKSLHKHLKVQVDRVIGDLKNICLADQRVGIALDNLQLVAKKFPELGGNYSILCKFCLAEFNSIREESANAIVANNFELFEHKFSNLQQAANNHCISSHIGKKALIDSVHVLSKSMIEHVRSRSEIAKESLAAVLKSENESGDYSKFTSELKESFNILSRAKQVLQHFEGNKVQSMYEEVEHLLMESCTEIVNEIEACFKLPTDKRDQAFAKLKHLLKKMSSFRMTEIVQQKTQENYFSTLNKICHYVMEAGKDAKILVKELNRVNDAVDYKDLFIACTTLENAKWVDKYQPGTYTDIVSEIYQRLSEKSDDIQEKVRSVDLTLDNVRLFGRNYKMTVGAIDAIGKYFASHIQQLSKAKETTHHVFREKVDQVFNYISMKFPPVGYDIFSNTNSVSMSSDRSSVSKESGQDEAKIEVVTSSSRVVYFEFDDIEKAFDYLHACGKFPDLKDEAKGVLRNFERKIDQHFGRLQSDFDQSFSVVEHSGKHDEEKIKKSAVVLGIVLEHLQRLQKNAPRAFRSFGISRLDRILARLRLELVETISTNIKRLTAARDETGLSNLLTTLRLLKHLDRVLNGRPFAELYTAQLRMEIHASTETEGRLLKLLKENEYNELDSELIRLQSRIDDSNDPCAVSNVRVIKRQLVKHIKVLLEETETGVLMLRERDIDFPAVNVLTKQFKHIRAIQQMEELDKSQMQELKNHKKDIDLALKKKLERYVKTIERTIGSGVFGLATQQTEKLNQIVHRLARDCPTEVRERSEGLDKMMQSTLDELIKKYSNMDPSDYSVYPPREVMERLKKANECSPDYATALEVIHSGIVKKYREKCSAELPQITLDDVDELEASLDFLPDETQRAVRITLKAQKAKMLRQCEKSSNLISQCIKAEDLLGLKNQLQTKLYDSGQKDSILGHISQAVQKLHSELTEHLEESPVSDKLIYKGERLYEYFSYFSQDVDLVASKMKSFIVDFQSKVNQACGHLTFFFGQHSHGSIIMGSQFVNEFQLYWTYVKYHTKCSGNRKFGSNEHKIQLQDQGQQCQNQLPQQRTHTNVSVDDNSSGGNNGKENRVFSKIMDGFFYLKNTAKQKQEQKSMEEDVNDCASASQQREAGFGSPKREAGFGAQQGETGGAGFGLFQQPISAVVKEFDSFHSNLTKYLNAYCQRIKAVYTSRKEFSIVLKDILTVRRHYKNFFDELKDYAHYSQDNQSKLFVSFIKAVNAVPTEKELIDNAQKHIRNILDQLRDFSLGSDLITREECEELKTRLLVIGGLHVLVEFFNSFVKEANRDAVRNINDKITKATISVVGRMREEEFLETKEHIRSTNMLYQALSRLRTELDDDDIDKDLLLSIGKCIEQIENEFKKMMRQTKNKIDGKFNPEEVGSVLIAMKRLSESLYSLKERLGGKNHIAKVLKKCRDHHGSSSVYGQIVYFLNKDPEGYGKMIADEHPCFKGQRNLERNRKTQCHGIEYVLRLITEVEVDVVDEKVGVYEFREVRVANSTLTDLARKYEQFRELYDDLVKKIIAKKLDVKTVVRLAKSSKPVIDYNHESKDKSKVIDWDREAKLKIPDLLAYIFALWTLQNADEYLSIAEKTDDQTSYLLLPHAAQVIAVFRILNLDEEGAELANHLAQVKTGEGKSVILAAVSAVLALLGIKVSVASCSRYLCERDYRSFKWLFDQLEVTDKINYGTFDHLCEQVINEDGDVRDVVQKFVCDDKIYFKKSDDECAHILLIDEVDVFFKKDFYSNLYCPTRTLRNPTIGPLVEYIWNEKPTRLQPVIKRKEYKNCIAEFKGWEKLIEENVKCMISDVSNLDSHTYVVDHDKICYVQPDGLSDTIQYGYKTMFAYYQEFDNNNISEASLEAAIGINLFCGRFSYAEMPHRFNAIMGVTGTLQELSDYQKQVIYDDYQVRRQSFVPSVYGKRNLVFPMELGKGVCVLEDEEYFFKLVNEINAGKIGNKGGERAVLVFFPSKKQMDVFLNNHTVKAQATDYQILHERTEEPNRSAWITRATTPGQVTLLTRSYGRGTDFVCYHKSVASNGGVHVIQTFLSDELSEEVQIKGRTARQGQLGSFTMFLKLTELEQFGVSKEDVFPSSPNITTTSTTVQCTPQNVYEKLNVKRTEFLKCQYLNINENVIAAREEHTQANAFLLDLKNNEIEKAKEYLLKRNKGPQLKISSRTLILMDATCSMHTLLEKTKSTISVMYERAFKVMLDENITSGFQIQFAVYRNYNCNENEILQYSPWESQADGLVEFMKGIEVQGGWGNEAIEIGLWHANQQAQTKKGLSQVILIGDAPPNTMDEVKLKRNSQKRLFVLDYWSRTKYKEPTHYEKELRKLTLEKIPVHTFHLTERAAKEFKGIATTSGGTNSSLDIKSPDGAKVLTDLVTQEILRNVGGAKGDQLVKEYRQRYMKSHNK